MKTLIASLIWLAAALPLAAADGVLEITISYRERIAPPPDAVAEVMLLDTSRADDIAPQLSGQRFALTGVPMTVQLHYDPALIRQELSYSISAAILSSGKTLFRTTSNNPVLTRGAPNSAELILTHMGHTHNENGGQARITGLAWAAYEIGGRALIVDDPPTLTLDVDGRFGLYSGCNRFTGRAEIDAGTIEFPENFAGTLMACPEDRERLQRETLDALRNVTGYTRNGHLLAFTNDAGVVTIRFREQPE